MSVADEAPSNVESIASSDAAVGMPDNALDVRLVRVIAFLNEHVARRISLDDLAHEAGVSRFHLIVLFRNAFGTSPHQFFIDVRLRAAAALLVETTAPVSDVAVAVGYGTTTHFITSFRRRYRITPQAYRRSEERRRRTIDLASVTQTSSSPRSRAFDATSVALRTISRAQT